jgi:hypothetical protein
MTQIVNAIRSRGGHHESSHSSDHFEPYDLSADGRNICSTNDASERGHTTETSQCSACFWGVLRHASAGARTRRGRLRPTIQPTTENKLAPEQAYNGARVSVRTTFDAVTHALLFTKMTNEKGQNLGLAIDLIDARDQVLEKKKEQGPIDSSAS